MKLRLLLATLCLCLASCSKRDIPATGPAPVVRAWVLCKGRSMLPAFPEKAMVEFEFGVPYSQLKAGDTVIFWDYKRGESALTHHRLMVKQGASWIAQGDNNGAADQSWVTADNYLARGTGKWLYQVSPQ